jgi:hypothetical protein
MATVTIFVSLDETANPAVQLSDSAGNSARSEKVDPCSDIKWQKKGSSDPFDIIDLSPTGPGEVFSPPTTGGAGQWLECRFGPPGGDPSNTKYPYTLTVEAQDGTHYTTTDTGPNPDNGRPVIRN